MKCMAGGALGGGKNQAMTGKLAPHPATKDSGLRRRSPRTETWGFGKIVSMETEVTENYGRRSSGE